MSNPDRLFDKTHLSIDMAEERRIVHRDYIAHCLRWSHVVKFLYKQHAYKTARILDIGCGKDVPLARLLYSNKMSGASYVGCDMNVLEMPEMLKKAVTNMKMEVRLKSNCDASTLQPGELPWAPNIITSFECYEHMHPAIGKRMLNTMFHLMADDGHLFFSTPCFNGSGAANHVNEPTYEAMGACLEQAGWNIVAHYGTFASQTDYKHLLSNEQAKIFNELQEYYDSNLLAVMMAPLFPHASRNVLWHCTKRPTPSKLFPNLADVKRPWSQHPEYENMLVQEQGS